MESSARVSETPTDSTRKSSEEVDLFKRSKKKVRSWEGDGDDPTTEHFPCNVTPTQTPSYKEKLLNLFGEEIPDNLDTKAMYEKWSKEAMTTESPTIDLTSDSGVEIPLTDEEWDSWSKPWRKTLVVNLLRKKVSFKSLENYLQRKWTKHGPIKIVDMADGFYLVHFSKEEDYNFALFEGPWMIADHYLIVQRWRPFFLQNTEQVSKVAIWLRFPKLPFELYNVQFLWRIGSALGTTLKADRLTSIHSRGKYSRICVEVDLAKPLASHMILRGHKLLIKYEGLHLICFRCGIYGHKADKCQQILEAAEASVQLYSETLEMDKNNRDTEEKAINGQAAAEKVHVQPNVRVEVAGETFKSDVSDPVPESEENSQHIKLGPWNHVQRKPRAKNQGPKSSIMRKGKQSENAKFSGKIVNDINFRGGSKKNLITPASKT